MYLPQRAFEPPEVKHDRLMVISVGGFIVNLVGIFVFHHGGSGKPSFSSPSPLLFPELLVLVFSHSGHGHSHGHSGHGHSHGHSGHGHSHGHSGHGHSHGHSGHGHSHGHSDHERNHVHNHGHSHGSGQTQIMQGRASLWQVLLHL